MARSDMSDLEWEFIKAVLPNKTRGLPFPQIFSPRRTACDQSARLANGRKLLPGK